MEEICCKSFRQELATVKIGSLHIFLTLHFTEDQQISTGEKTKQTPRPGDFIKNNKDKHKFADPLKFFYSYITILFLIKEIANAFCFPKSLLPILSPHPHTYKIEM